MTAEWMTLQTTPPMDFAWTSEQLELHITFERGVANRGPAADVKFYSAKNPSTYQISKQEQVLEVRLTPRHRKVYETHLQRERQAVLGLVEDLQDIDHGVDVEGEVV